jgi:tetratricopeptide (TPR) repeat protein
MRSFVRLSAIVFFSTISALFADSAADFANANREYAAGHFQAATEGYEALVRAGQTNPVLFYNLGNAWYRRGDLARAILNYERALALEPRHAEATANLRLVRDQARALELTASGPERYLDSITSDAYAWMAAIGFWVGAFAFASFLFRRSTSKAVAMIVAFLFAGGALYALYTVENGSHGQSLAIVVGKNIDARLATADNANSVLALPPGSEINLLSTRGDWSYAALPNNLRGWVPTTSAESVRM